MYPRNNTNKKHETTGSQLLQINRFAAVSCDFVAHALALFLSRTDINFGYSVFDIPIHVTTQKMRAT